MLLRLASIGALAYLGYKFVQANGSQATAPSAEPSDLRLAGGPLSPQATVQHTADAPAL